MNIKTLRKADRMAVMPAKDGAFMVGGDSAVYKVWLSKIEGRWLCECRAGANTTACSHKLAVRLHTERTVAQATEMRTAHG